MIHGKMGEVLSVYTLPAYRRQGIAQHNMQRLVEPEQWLDSESSATKAGYPVYQKVGFSGTATALYRDADSVNKNRIFVQM